MEISLKVLIDRQQVRAIDLIERQQRGDPDPLLAANLEQAEDRMDELNHRLERRSAELQQERHLAITDIHYHGRAWVLPHPERQALNIAPMVRDEQIERIAITAAIAYETARGWQVESVERDNKGFDLISRRFSEKDPAIPVEVHYIEAKGRAHVGIVSLSSHEYQTVYRLKEDYWLYVVFNCATDPAPQPYCICNPVTLPWEPMQEVIQYRVEAQAIMDSVAKAEPTPPSPVAQAFQSFFQSRLADLAEYNLLVEGLSDKTYLELAAQLYKAAHGVDLFEHGRIRIVAGRGTKRFGPEFGLLQALEQQGLHFVVMLDGDKPGRVAADAFPV